MHICLSARPCPALRKYVRVFAQREVSSGTPAIVEPFPACLDTILQLDFQRSPIIEFANGLVETRGPISLVGPHTYRRASVRLQGPTDSFAVFFRPLGFWRLFHVPGPLLVNQDYQGVEILGNGIGELLQQMAESLSFRDRVEQMEAYLVKQVGRAMESTSVVKSALQLVNLQGVGSIGSLAQHAALSVRQFERRFRDEIGITPKLFARIVRYQVAIDSKIRAPHRSWLEIAHEFGYHDQMHLVHDFQSLTGSSPSSIVPQLKDMRPAALGEYSEFV